MQTQSKGLNFYFEIVQHITYINMLMYYPVLA